MIKLSKTDSKIIKLAALGGMLELYDFAIYGVFAMYFANQFFPSNNPIMEILESIMIFMLGFVLRPIGGVFFSSMGDKYGRKNILIVTVFLMGISSLGIALLPVYRQIGFFAPLFLVIFRLLQGLAVGGELPATFVYLQESIAKNNKVLAFALTMAGVFGGYLLALLIKYALALFFDEVAIRNYAWRIPFVLGGIICFVSFFIRKSLHETHAFQNVTAIKHKSWRYIFTNYKLNIALGICISATQQVFSILVIIFMPTYLLKFIHLTNSQITIVMLIGVLVTIFTSTLFGLLINSIKKVFRAYQIGVIANIFIVSFGFWLISIGLIAFGLIILMIGHAILGVLVPMCLSQLFPVEIRLRGVAISYNLAILIFGSSVPLIITYLIFVSQLTYLIPGLVFSLLLLLAISVLNLAKRHISLGDIL